MRNKRQQISKPVKEAVLKEFNHRCAVCGADRPHLHHIDGDNSKSMSQNLIPLCPNCHLTDQHDASNAVPHAKLLFFRRHKHRMILKPQFNPVFSRLSFLYSIDDVVGAGRLKEQSDELARLVENFSMGSFYASEIRKLLKPPSFATATILGDPESEAMSLAHKRKMAQQYRDQLRSSIEKVEALIVEMLDYQAW